MLGEKGRDLTQSNDKSHYTHTQIQNATQPHNNFDYTTITDQLRTVSCSNESHTFGIALILQNNVEMLEFVLLI